MDWLLLAESPLPDMDAAYWIGIVSRVLHTTAAAVLLGGLVYLRQVVAPLAAGADDVDDALYRGQRGAWSRLVMMATLFLLVSGFYNFFNIVGASEKLPRAYHLAFGAKFPLALFVFFVAAATAGKTPVAMKMRANLGKWLNLSLLALLAIFVLGAVMRSFEKVPKPADETAQATHTQSSNQHG